MLVIGPHFETSEPMAVKLGIKGIEAASEESVPPPDGSGGARAGTSDILFFLFFAPLIGFVLVNLLAAAADYGINGDPRVEVVWSSSPQNEDRIRAAIADPESASVVFGASGLSNKGLRWLLEGPEPLKRSAAPTHLAWADTHEAAASERSPPPARILLAQAQGIQKQLPQQQQQQRQQQQQQLPLEPYVAPSEPASLADLVNERSVALDGGPGDALQPGSPGAYIRLGDAVSLEAPGSLFYAVDRVQGPGGATVLAARPESEVAIGRIEVAALATTLLKADDSRRTTLLVVGDSIASVEAGYGPVRGLEPWGERIRSIAPLVEYLGHLRSIQFMDIGTEAASVLAETGTAWGLLKRRLWMRTPVEGREAIIPLRVGESQTLSFLAADEAPEVIELDDRSLSPAYRLQPSMTALPLALGLVAFLLAAAAAAFVAHRRVHVLNLASEAPWLGLLVLMLPLPLAYAAVTWASWTMPINWLPDADPLLASAGVQSLLHAFVILSGAASGGMLYRVAFRPSAPQDGTATTESLRASLLREVPVDDLRRDRLGFANLVLALARLFDNKDTVPPIVVAVTGPWGSGKSSIMRMLETELAATERFHFAWFNAWQYRDEKQILDAFLRTIARGLSRHYGPLFMPRIAWTRVREATYLQLLKYASPLFLLAAGAMLAWRGGAPDADNEWLSILASAGQWLLTALGLGGTVELIRWVRPFRQPLGQLLALPGAETEMSHVEQFNQEFRLFRKSVGDKKFLIFIDDLDRCPPDAVVEVLKTINLIATADEGPGKTFFILGMDWHYVLRAIEKHFEKFIGDEGQDGRFGREYLKKIVTLPLSVPRPSRTHIEALVAGIETDRAPASDPPPIPDTPRDASRVRRWLVGAGRWLDGFAERPFNVFATILVIAGLAAGITWSLSTDRAPTTSEPTALQDAGEARPAAPEPADGETRTVTFAVADEPEAEGGWSGWSGWYLVLAGLAALVAMMAAWSRMDRLRREAEAPPEPSDPQSFVDAVKQLSVHMPDNPRDVIRLVNLMRVAYLVQDPRNVARPAHDPRPTAGPDLFSGSSFTPAESTRFSLLYYTMADALDVERIQKELLPALDRGEGLKELSQSEDRATAWWASDLLKRLEHHSDLLDLVHEPGKVRRFVEIYRNLLSAGRERTSTDSGAPLAQAAARRLP